MPHYALIVKTEQESFVLEFDINSTDNLTGLDIKKKIQEKKGIHVADQEIRVGNALWTKEDSYLNLKNKFQLSYKLEHFQIELVVKQVPDNLRQLINMDYNTLKYNYIFLANEIANLTRTNRYSSKKQENIENYWNNSGLSERANILQHPSLTELTKTVSTPYTLPLKAEQPEENNHACMIM